MWIHTLLSVCVQPSLESPNSSSTLSLPMHKGLQPPCVAHNAVLIPGEGQAGVPGQSFPPGAATHWPLCLQTFLPPPTSLTATVCSSSETFSEFVVCRINPKRCWTQSPQRSGPRIFLSLSFPPFLKSSV